MAAFMEWNDKVSVGIEEIDEQHKQLLDLINRLYDAMISGEQKLQVAKDVLNELMQYTVVHFAVEESLFRIFDYPDYEAHCAHHHELRAQVIDINRKVQSGEKMVTPELLVFLRKWLTNHIMVEDKAYAPVLLERGLKKNWEKKGWMGKIWSAVR